jgi:ABC-type Zn uptake system ZnuABC Zn-binding protein ZnuA
MKNSNRYYKQFFKSVLILTAILFIQAIDISAQGQQRAQVRYRGGRSDKPLNIVCSFSDFASITQFIAGDRAQVSYIANGEQDPHFVPPKPSYAVMLSTADMWIATGMDLEMWSATLLDKAHNNKIMDGEIGFVAAAQGVNVVEKVEFANRSEGDIHLMGNPHITTGPLNWKVIAQNITIGLVKVDPANAAFYQQNRDAFTDKVDRELFGDKLVDLFGGPTLSKMLEIQLVYIPRETYEEKT